jgi:hypothetical protein
MVWRLLDMGLIASKAIEKGKKNDFYIGKVLQATYFADIILPHTLATVKTCLREGREVVEMPIKGF